MRIRIELRGELATGEDEFTHEIADPAGRSFAPDSDQLLDDDHSGSKLARAVIVIRQRLPRPMAGCGRSRRLRS